MPRIIIAGVVGAVVYFIWGMAAWIFIPLHTPTMAGLPDEDAVTEALTQQNLETGVYSVPWSNNSADWNDPESDFSKKHLAGPLYTIYYHRDGHAPMGIDVMIRGFAIDLLAAMLAACLLSGAASGCCRSYAQRIGFVTGLGIFVGLVGHASYWNWMFFPADYTLAFIADNVIGWTLTGLVIAAIIRPAVSTGSTTEPRTPS